MASTHTSRTLLTSQSLSAAASVNATEWDNSTKYGGMAYVKLSLPGSAPTTVPVVKFFIGESTGTKRLLYTASGSVTSGDYPIDIGCQIPAGAMFVNVTITNGATNAITVEAYAQELTTL